MANIIILATSNVAQDGLIITDSTDWTSLGVPRGTITSLTVSLYEAMVHTAPAYSAYTLSASELLSFVTDGTVEIPFLSLAGVIYLEDSWWEAVASGNSGAYISNYAGFGVYASITYAVFNQVNWIHAPEEIKFNAERYAISVFFLEGLGNLDTTNVNSRDVKFQKRLISLQKMLLNI